MTRTSLLRRDREVADYSVSPLELFFDLVFVFAVTQLSHYLLHHHDLLGALQTLLLFLAIWWAWVFTAWATNWLDPEQTPVRILLLLIMIASMVMSSAIPDAFGRMGLAFALSYVAIQVGRTAYTAWAREGFPGGSSTNMARATLYFALAAPLWIAGGLDFDPLRRMLWWTAALAIEYAGPFSFFYVPTVGRSSLAEWRINGGHMAERCSLFIILSLGEGILVTGASFAEGQTSLSTMMAFGSAFIASVAMWWIYFDIGWKRGRDLIEHDSLPGLLGRQAYTYAHIPIVAGIIVVAVSDEQLLAHPGGGLEPFFIAALVGGGLLFIGGNMLFKRMTSGQSFWPLSHAAGLILFILLGLWGWLMRPAPLALHLAATSLFILVAAWEWVSFHGGWAGRLERLAVRRQSRTRR